MVRDWFQELVRMFTRCLFAPSPRRLYNYLWATPPFGGDCRQSGGGPHADGSAVGGEDRGQVRSLPGKHGSAIVSSNMCPSIFFFWLHARAKGEGEGVRVAVS